MSPYAVLLGLSAWAFCTGLAASPSDSPELGLNADVAFVSTGGAWAKGDRTGAVRVVVVNGGFEHVTSRVFLQWLAVNREKGIWIVDSVAVDRINNPGVWSLGQPALSYEDGVTIVRLHATNPYDGEDTVFMLSVKGPGDFGVEAADTEP